MKISRKFGLIGILLALSVGLAACDKPGPAESAGKKMDQAVDDANRKIEESTDYTASKLSQQGEKTGMVIDDAEITAKVKAAIFAEPGLRSMQISVSTVKGVVALSGSVDSPSHSDLAKALAKAVSGVNEVKNLLEVKPGN